MKKILFVTAMGLGLGAAIGSTVFSLRSHRQANLAHFTADMVHQANAAGALGTYVVHANPGFQLEGWRCEMLFVEKNGAQQMGCFIVRGGASQPFHTDYFLPGETGYFTFEFLFPHPAPSSPAPTPPPPGSSTL
jgi:hypothetical protein